MDKVVKLIIFVVCLALGGYKVWDLRRRRHPIGPGLGVALDRSTLPTIIAGVAISFLAITVMFFFEVAIGAIRSDGFGSVPSLASDLLTFLTVPLIEELVFRAFLLGGLVALLRRGWALPLVISAAVFGAAHAVNENATILGVIGATIGGFVYGTAYIATERIWLPFGLHFGWNYAEGPIFGFAISGGVVRQPLVHLRTIGPPLVTGGSYGPEGGLAGFAARILVLAMVAAWIQWFSESGRKTR
jgi:membrane protease YdiL (CAAX protease family)